LAAPAPNGFKWDANLDAIVPGYFKICVPFHLKPLGRGDGSIKGTYVLSSLCITNGTILTKDERGMMINATPMPP
jgi:hypothetical protein